MAGYSISYDLRKPGRDYSKLHDAIKALGVWWHYLESTWLVDTSLSASDIETRLLPAIDANDRLLIVELGRGYGGYLPQEAWTWLRSHTHAA